MTIIHSIIAAMAAFIIAVISAGGYLGIVLLMAIDSQWQRHLTDLDIRAGGIVLLLVGKLEVGAAGAITATPPDPSRDVAPSGGYVYVRGTTLSVGDGRVSARGAYGRSVNGPSAGQFNQAGPGYIVLEGAVTGTTDPVAKILP